MLKTGLDGHTSPSILMLAAVVVGGATLVQLGAGTATGPTSRTESKPAATATPALVQVLDSPTRLMADFLALDTGSRPDVTIASELWTAAASRGVTRLTMLVASIPDYVDSSSDWTADVSLDAIQRAAAALGYRFDRFALPDWPPQGGDGVGSRHQHETDCGALLFRRPDLSSPSSEELLVVFVVLETPTAGIHRAAFERAATTISQWSAEAKAAGIGCGECGTLLVIGPTFSGSAMSLRAALTDPAATAPFERVRVVSGTATNARNVGILTFGKVTFTATVHTDDDLLSALERFLTSVNPAWADGDGVAILSESNTSYGESFGTVGQGTAFRKALRMSFPLHVSRLRGLAGSVRPNASPTTGATGAPLHMEPRQAATDRLPSLAPELVSTTVELTLANILDAIRRERKGAVGVFTTDKRDYLFLSREIIRAAPNVLLFTTEGDLLFTHRDYGGFVRGTVVASSYPLFSGSQWLTSPGSAAVRREQFPTMGAQGVYNATLALLPPSPSDRVRPSSFSVDYGAAVGPECAPPNPCVPPIWISVAGRDALWPLTVDEQVASRDAAPRPMAEASPIQPDSASGSAANIVHPAPLVWILLVIVTAAAFGHGVVYLLSVVTVGQTDRGLFAGVRRALRRLQSQLQDLARREVPVARFFDTSRQRRDPDELEEPVLVERRRFLLTCFCAVTMVALWMWHLWVVWRTGAFPTALSWWSACLLAFLALAVAGFADTWKDRIRHAAGRRHGDPAGAKTRPAVVATITGLLMAVPAICAAIALLNLNWHISTQPAWYAPLLLVRTLGVDNGVSQAPIGLCLAATLYLWAFWNVRQLSMRGDSYDVDSGVFRILCGPALTPAARSDAATASDAAGVAAAHASSHEPLREELGAVAASPWRRTRTRLLSGVVVTVVVYGALTWDMGSGIDGKYFSRFVWWATLLCVFLLAHSTSQTLHLAMLLARVLDRLTTHPIAPAFKRVAERGLFDWAMSVRPTDAWRLAPALYITRDLRSQSEALGIELPAEKLAAAELAVQREPVVAFLRNDAWPFLERAATCVRDRLDAERWRKGEAGGPAWLDSGEDLLAVLASFVIRDLLSRVVTGLSIALAMLLLILSSHVLYLFQGRHLFVWLDLGLLMVLAAIGTVILVHFDRNRILSWSWSTVPGRVSWSGGFLQRLAIWAVFTLSPLAAARFPELGETVTTWLEPLRKVLP